MYSVELTPTAERQIEKLSKAVQQRILRKLSSPSWLTNPRGKNTEKLEGNQTLYRIRVGDYRIVYEIGDEQLLIVVVRVGHRREVYRKKF